MLSFRSARLAVVLLGLAWCAAAQAQSAQGFAVERLYQSAPGGGWMVMDNLDMHGALGGAVALSGGYALNPLQVGSGSQHLDVVENEAFADIGVAVTYDRFRLYANLPNPVLNSGKSGTAGGAQFSAPAVNIAQDPDLIADPRIGFDARIFGAPGSAFRLGAGAQLIIPNGARSEYDTDNTYRAMIRALGAGDVGLWTYAGQLGVHIRPLDTPSIPDSPRGSELLFGFAAGPKFLIGHDKAIILGPEIYGETALKAFFGSSTTGIEGLISGRLEWIGENRANLRIKLATGGGIDQHFGAPEWRAVVAVEMFGNIAR